jgi:hypothetical protein
MTTSPMLDAEIKLPEKLNIIKLVTYDVPVVIKLMEEQGLEDIELDDVVAWLEDEITAEFNSRLKELIFETEYGEEVYGANWGTR